MKKDVRSEFENIEGIKEDCQQYREIAHRYLFLKSEDYVNAYDICQKSWALAQRWSDIQSNAGKLASIKEISKTAFATWAYQRYRQLQLMHEHTRVIWRMGEDEAKKKNNGY